MSNKADMYSINNSKACADWKKYASLFEKHIRPLENGDVCFISIGNIDVVFKLLESFKNCKIYIYDNESLCKSIELLAPAYGFDAGQFVFNCSDDILESIKESTMKFDRIVMNPPYSKNLHLKILAEAIKHLKDDDSTCVNLSPVRWLQDPLAKYKKNSDYHRFEESVSKHLITVDVIKASDANSMFGIENFTDLGIYIANLGYNAFRYDSILSDAYLGNRKNIFNKIYAFCKTSNMNNHVEWNLNGISVKFNCLFGGHNNPYTLVTTNHSHPYIDGKTEDGRTYADCAFKKKDVDENKQTQSTVKFATVEEAKNFIKTVQTDFFMFVNSLTKRDVHVSLMALPWLGDVVNPRTGLKGYQGEWTDEDLYTFFDINDDEKKVIEETMAKYK